jgi:hypothetical protein
MSYRTWRTDIYEFRWKRLINYRQLVIIVTLKEMERNKFLVSALRTCVGMSYKQSFAY